MTSLRKGLKHQFLTYPKRATPFLLGLGFVTFYLPYLISYHVGPIPSFLNEVTAIGFSSLFLLFLYRSRLGSYNFPFSAIGPVCLGAILILQALLCRPAYWDQRLVPFLILCWFSLLIFFFANLQEARERFLAAAAWGLFTGAITTTLVIFLQRFPGLLPFHPLAIFVSPGAGFGNIAQVNHAAALLAMGFASGILLIQQGQLPKIVCGISLASLLWGGVMTGSKGFVVYIITLLTICCWFFIRRKEGKTFLRKWILLVGVGGVLFLLIGYMTNMRGFVGLLLPAVAFRERGPAILHAWRLFTDDPVLGFGWSQFSYGVYLNSSLAELPKMWALGLTLPNHCHNIIFQLLATVGFLGATSALATFIPLRWKVLTKEPEPIWQWLLSVLVVLVLFSMWEYPLWYAYFLLPLALVLGVASKTVEVKVGVHARCYALLIPLIIAGFLVKHSTDYINLTVSLEKINAPEFDQNIVTTLGDLQRRTLFSSYVEWFCPGILTPENSSSPEGQIATCERMLKTMPVAEVAYRIPLLYQQMNESNKAVYALEQAYAAFPYELKDYVESFRLASCNRGGPLFEKAMGLIERQTPTAQ
jgi:hypothetical protein